MPINPGLSTRNGTISLLSLQTVFLKHHHCTAKQWKAYCEGSEPLGDKKGVAAYALESPGAKKGVAAYALEPPGAKMLHATRRTIA